MDAMPALRRLLTTLENERRPSLDRIVLLAVGRREQLIGTYSAPGSTAHNAVIGLVSRRGQILIDATARTLISMTAAGI